MMPVPLYTPSDRRVIPEAAVGSHNALGIQRLRDRAQADAGCELLENAPYDNGLRFIDLTVSVDQLAARIKRLYHSVAERDAAADLALLDAAALAAMRLRCNVLEQQGIHRVLQIDVQMCDVSFGLGDHTHIGEGQTLKQAGNVLLVAR